MDNEGKYAVFKSSGRSASSKGWGAHSLSSMPVECTVSGFIGTIILWMRTSTIVMARRRDSYGPA